MLDKYFRAILETADYIDIKNIEIYMDNSIPVEELGEKRVLLKAGCRETAEVVKFLRGDLAPGRCLLRAPYTLWEHLKLAEVKELNVRVDNDKIFLGPIMGVLISENKQEGLTQGKYDSVYALWETWSSREKGLVIFFTINDINWEEKKVKAYRYDSKYRWMCGYYPLPQIIYDRCFGEKGRQDSYQLRYLIQHNAPQVRVFNQAVKIGKYETYEHLNSYCDTEKLIPPYSKFTWRNLIYFLKTYKSFFLKPDKLYKGEGIIYVKRQGRGYIFHYRSGEDYITLFCRTRNEIIEKLGNNFNHLEDEYIIQGEVELPYFMGSKFDIRVALQKGKENKWEVPAVNARLAPKNILITSPRSGGKVLRLSETLSIVFPGKEEEILNDIIGRAKLIGSRMEEKFGFMGELGVDIALDKRGRIWIIEVNGKPLKVSISRMKDRALKKAVNLNPLYLGFELDGFPLQEKNTLQSSIQEKQFRCKEKENENDSVIFLNKLQMDYLGYYTDQVISLQIGLCENKVKIKEQAWNNSTKEIYLSPAVFDHLNFFPNTVLNIISASKKKIVLGPTIGITVSEGTWEHLLEKNYSDLTQTAGLAAEKGALMYCFTVDGIHWDQKQVTALLYSPRWNSWIKKNMPFPQVLYDQATYPYDLEKRTMAKKVNKQMRQNHSIQPVNAKRFMGKGETYRALTFFDDLSPYVPETNLLQYSSLVNFLERYSTIFAKSNYGSHGKDVIKVERKGNVFTCQGGREEKGSRAFNNFLQLYKYLEMELGVGAVIQQGISPLSMMGHIFDLRVHCQKNIRGQWDIALVSIRLAQKDAIVTNASMGAEEIILAPGDYVPFGIFSWDKLWNLSYRALLSLEANFGKMGEIGLDIGIDTSGNYWIYEANSKPSTLNYSELIVGELSRKLFSFPIDYALHLAANEQFV